MENRSVAATVIALVVWCGFLSAEPGREAAVRQQAAATTLPDEPLPKGARIYVAPMPNGFDTYVIAGFQNKQVPVIVVTVREKADYELTGVSETDKAGWAKTLFTGSTSTAETASIKIVDLKSDKVVFAYSYHTGNSVRGRQSAGESVAKHIKERMVKGGGDEALASSVPSIHPGAKVFVSAMENGFDDYLRTAFEAKKVPVQVVADRSLADFEISGHAESQKAGAAKILLKGDIHSSEEASVVVSDLKTSVVVFSYSVDKSSSAHGKQSTAEAVAKHLKDWIEGKD
jgi:hypothetical protein